MSKIIDDLKLQYKLGGIAERLIYWNVGCFLVSLVFYNFRFGGFEFPSWIALSSIPLDFFLKPWTLVTYAFLHDGFWHLFFNMMVLNFSSRLFLTFFNSKQFIGLYILSAIFSGLVFVIVFYFMKINSSIVGASAAIMAILVAATTYQPLMQLRLMFIGNVKLWQITAVILLLDLLQVRLDNSGGHIAHLAGAFFGYVYIKSLQNGTDLSNVISIGIDFFANLFKKTPSTPFKKVHKNYSHLPIKSVSKIVTKDKIQQQIDDILDKISKSGYDSLSDNEKDFLFKSGK